jgi:LmbE family N-acetylglucosaminyl deacetylase
MSPNTTSLEDLGVAPTSALAVVAHPDDESFGLGAILATLARHGAAVRVLSFTHGEASTLGACEDLGRLRAGELDQAAAELGVEQAILLDYPDGHLAEIPQDRLAADVAAALDAADLLVVFEPGGVTGHCDHRAATAAAHAVAAREAVRVLEWGLPPDVACTLNAEFGGAFVAAQGIDVEVDRSAQWRAIACHATQARDNPVLRRRLELLGDRERVQLVPASAAAPAGVPVTAAPGVPVTAAPGVPVTP